MDFRRFSKGIYPYFTVILVVLATTFFAWIPFINNFLLIYRNYDGPLYIIVSKTFYNPELIQKTIGSNPLYYAAHLPLYPFIIRLFSYVFGFLKSMIFVNLASTVALGLFFYFFVTKLNLTKKPIILTVVFLMLPRFLIVRSVGAPESLFILLILVSIYFFETKNFLLCGIAGFFAAITKTPGILLFVAYFFILIKRFINEKKFNFQWMYLLLIPLGLLSVFLLYQQQYNDFFAYFHTGGVVPMGFPFSVFNFNLKWIGTAWLEDIVFYLFIYGLTILFLKESKHRSFFYFGIVFFIASTLVQHRDIARYSLPLWPLACIAFEHFFTSKKFIIVLILLLPALYLYAWNFILYNGMPIADWKPFL